MEIFAPNNFSGSVTLEKSLLDKLLSPIILALFLKFTSKPKISRAKVPELTASITIFFFLLAIFLSPLALIVPAYATAGALIYVAILMLSGMEKLNWSNMIDLLPALIIIVMIPLTFSIADGIALGFLSYVVLKIGYGEISKISSGAWFLTLVFISKFIFL